VKIPYWRVEPEWKGETVAILGGGPSLTQDQVDRLRGRCRVIAVNNAYWLAPWADLLYFSDQVWWIWHHGGLEERQRGAKVEPVRHAGDARYHAFAGVKAALANACTHGRERAVRVLQNYGHMPGLCGIRDGVHTGRSSGYQAINLAAHLVECDAALLLLGFDMRAVNGRTHWHMAHHRATPEQDFANTMLPPFTSLVDPLAARAIRVLNCTPGSAIQCFPRAQLADALSAAGRQPSAVSAPCAAGA
jgi:hypothetical protein